MSRTAGGSRRQCSIASASELPPPVCASSPRALRRTPASTWSSRSRGGCRAMADQARIEVTVGPDGVVSAITHGLYGDRCLDYIGVLEDLLEARTSSSAYTDDYARTQEQAPVAEEVRHVDGQ